MLLIIFLSLIAKLTMVSCACDIGTQVVSDFDFMKVRISVWLRSSEQAAVQPADWVSYFICGSINDHSIEHTRQYVRVIKWFMDNYLLMIWKLCLGF